MPPEQKGTEAESESAVEICREIIKDNSIRVWETPSKHFSQMGTHLLCLLPAHNQTILVLAQVKGKPAFAGLPFTYSI